MEISKLLNSAKKYGLEYKVLSEWIGIDSAEFCLNGILSYGLVGFETIKD